MATAIETVEVMHTLQGKATDKDRHGAQQGIEGSTIGLFDVGQIPFNATRGRIEQPSKEQKFALGQTLAVAFLGASDRASAIRAFTEAVAANPDPSIKSYLVGEQRALLARADVHARLGAAEDKRLQAMADIFGAALHAGKLDKYLLSGVAEAVGVKPAELVKLLPTGPDHIKVSLG